MRFLRTVFTIGYIFFGTFFLINLGQLFLRNTWIDFFEIKDTKPLTFQVEMMENNKTEIQYTFKAEDEVYEGSRVVFNKLIEERLPENKEDVIVSYNTLIPKINFLKQLNLKSRNGYIGLIGFGLILIILLLIDKFVNKKYWLKVYGLSK